MLFYLILSLIFAVLLSSLWFSFLQQSWFLELSTDNGQVGIYASWQTNLQFAAKNLKYAKYYKIKNG